MQDQSNPSPDGSSVTLAPQHVSAVRAMLNMEREHFAEAVNDPNYESDAEQRRLLAQRVSELDALGWLNDETEPRAIPAMPDLPGRLVDAAEWLCEDVFALDRNPSTIREVLTRADHMLAAAEAIDAQAMTVA